jgi:hypothetical protein
MSEKKDQQDQISSEPKMDFDTWYAISQHLIPSHHKKEIIRADFQARGLDINETKDCFDNALKLYGVKL